MNRVDEPTATAATAAPAPVLPKPKIGKKPLMMLKVASTPAPAKPGSTSVKSKAAAPKPTAEKKPVAAPKAKKEAVGMKRKLDRDPGLDNYLRRAELKYEKESLLTAIDALKLIVVWVPAHACASVRWGTMTAAQQAAFREGDGAEHTDSEDDDDREKGKKVKKAKAKKPKDPNAPKRPTSGYFYYSNEQIPIIKSQQPTLPFGDVRWWEIVFRRPHLSLHFTPLFPSASIQFVLTCACSGQGSWQSNGRA